MYGRLVPVIDSRHTNTIDRPDADATIESRPVAGGLLLTVAVVLTALNLRPAITSVGPLLGDMRDTFGASAVWAGVLTTLPGLCFATAGLAAPRVAARIGADRAIAAALVILSAGLLLRVLDGPAVVIGGTLVATAGIALINVLIPVVIKRSFPARIGVMTGIYTAALQGGGALGSALTPALDAMSGWRTALGAWAALAALALALWLAATLRGTGRTAVVQVERTPEPRRSLMSSRLAWTVTSFFGCQAFLAYVVMGWLPAVFIDGGMSKSAAGLLLGLISVLAVPVSIVIAPAAARRPSQSGWIVGLGVLGFAGVTGLAVAPDVAPLLWSVLLGLGMSVFSLALTVIALRSRNAADTARLSGMAQGIGYLLAGVGPFLFGVLHDMTGGWTVSWGLVLAVYAVQLVTGAMAGRNRYV
ncbi:CynX/NimT family MFS transporter [Mycobacterium sp. BMJ-28]